MVLEPVFVLAAKVSQRVSRHGSQGDITGIICTSGSFCEPRRLVSGGGYNIGRHGY
jgi:hypothetical protein